MQDVKKLIEDLGVEKVKIMQDFDFAKTAALFRVLGYHYTRNEFPTETTLMSIASSILDTAIKEYERTRKPTRVSSGRLIAFVHDWNSCLELELVFDPCGISYNVRKD